MRVQRAVERSRMHSILGVGRPKTRVIDRQTER